MSFPLVQALYDALDEIAEDNDCWVVVLTGAGRGFCSGLDLHDRGVPPNSHDLGFSRLAMQSMSYMSDVVPAMRGIPQPIIAAINGPAYGGGMCLTLGADLRYASESAVFCSAGIINGLTRRELGATYLLPRAVGTSNAAELLLTGRKIDATEALRIGLVSKVVPDDALLDHALDTAEEMYDARPLRRDDDEADDVVEPRDHVARTPPSSSRTATSSSPATPATSTKPSPRSARSASRSTRSDAPPTGCAIRPATWAMAALPWAR